MELETGAAGRDLTGFYYLQNIYLFVMFVSTLGPYKLLKCDF